MYLIVFFKNKKEEKMKTYTTAELEPILKRKAKTIRKMITSKKLKASKNGNDYIVTEDDVKEYFCNNRAFEY